MNRLIIFCGLLMSSVLLINSSFTRCAPAPTLVVKTNADSGPGSLRSAITFANQHPSTTIAFKIPPPQLHNGIATIRVKTPLPAIISNGTAIDGATQAVASASPAGESAAHPRIVLQGTLLGTAKSFDGLVIKAAHCLIRKVAVSDFSGIGIDITGATAKSNEVTGCYVGLSADGLKPLPNDTGLVIEKGAAANVIGGTTDDARNIISGNAGNGLSIKGIGTANNLVKGNYIGTNPSGQMALSNDINGIQISDGAERTTVGGTQAEARNLISGNGWAGILIVEAHNNMVAGNYIGTDSSGSKPIGNGNCGINISGASKNTIGGTTSEARNIIAGNTEAGIAVRDSGAEHNVIEDNYLGTDVSGTKRLDNDTGVVIRAEAQFNTVGGTTVATRNLISGNKQHGVAIADPGTRHNTVAGNFIGTDVTGTGVLGNGEDGVLIDIGADSNAVGGTISEARNVIAGNKKSGVNIEDAKTNQNLVQGNYIGMDVSGTKALGNGYGVTIQDGAQSNTVGGTTPEARNIIAGNEYTGVNICDTNTSHNTVDGNFIGTDASGKVGVGNGREDINVYLYKGATSNMIGGSTPGAGNVIAFNDYGVLVQDPQTVGNSIRGNSIRANNPTGKHLGITLLSSPIDISGLSILHPPGTPGPNHLLIYPAIVSARRTPEGVTLSGIISGQTGKQYSLDFFASPTTTPIRYGEGQVYLGSVNLPMANRNNTNFVFSLPGDVHNKSITATMTDLETGDTSEFSRPTAVLP